VARTPGEGYDLSVALSIVTLGEARRKGAAVHVEVDRNDLRTVRVRDDQPAELRTGQARLRVESFALTSNNITYGVFGDALRYWDFFPAAAADDVAWGRIPVWGFAEVIDSAAGGVPEGARLYGYLPMSTELVVTPGRLDGRGFADTAEHRAPMAGAYNRYLYVAADPIYDPAREGEQMVLWPLFFTSFVVDDFLGDAGLFGARRVLISSASSKTSIGTAHLLARRVGVEVVGLTSPANAPFVRSLGCYHHTATYDALGELPPGPAVFVDVAGDSTVTRAVHEHYGDALTHSMIVGSTHWDAPPPGAGALPGPERAFFFAPAQIAKRTVDWGREGLDARVGSAWRDYVGFTDSWLELRYSRGPQAVERTYRALLDGRIDPRQGHVCTMHTG
jgi:hypothetical protein